MKTTDATVAIASNHVACSITSLVPEREVAMSSTVKEFEGLASILLWPLLLKITLASFFHQDVHYLLCVVGEITVFGLFRMIGIALGIYGRKTLANPATNPPQ